MLKRLAFAAGLLLTAATAQADPRCDSPTGWFATTAFAHLKNAGMLNSADNADLSRIQVARIASEKIGPDLYRQVHRITFTRKNGDPVRVITVGDASSQECSMGDVEVSVVFLRLGGKEAK